MSTLAVSNLKHESASGNNIVLASDGKVGVGAASPAVAMDVVGQVRASTGILFGSDTAAANALDDYEEGTWTPVLGGSTSESGQAYSRQSGHYVKIGKQVTCTFNVVMTTEGTIVGGARIKGLPFTVSTLAIGGDGGRGNRAGLAVGYYGSLGSNVVFLGGFPEFDTTNIHIFTTSAAADGTVAPTGSALYANGTEIIGSFTYFTN